ncbi:MAG TPA: sigma-54 dependent transcriptional regulator [Longimicrobium sp.]|uniref:sigma-54-dependent transcriptional regulator n=1 Tax=Longimicrobium sp. TaxID=2029185 RepID=UPI002ED96172
MSARVLVVDDQQIVRDLVAEVMRQAGYAVDTAPSGEEALRALDREMYDLVLLDINLPGVSGMDVLGAARALQMDAEFIMLTGFGSVESAVEAMRLGAYDYLNKPVDVDELALTAERALRERETRRELARLRAESGSGIRQRLVGRTPAMHRLWELLERVAPTRATVLVTGETGTGKELVARAIHELSDRARRPFIAVNCSALPETLLESELFGHVKGAFTGALNSRRGLVEEAAGGTLFLDEIASISFPTQVKLLRVLQERKIQRVGGGPEVSVDFRLVAAANVDLGGEVEAGRFREDLYYRLNVFPVQVPALRERAADIPLLVQHFRQRFARENGVEPPQVSPETLARMQAYEWPGNVRELENWVERALILHAGSRTLAFDPPRPPSAPSGEHGLLGRARAERWGLERLEREYILSVLEEVHGHQGRATEILGVDRRTLQRKLARYREGDGVA